MGPMFKKLASHIVAVGCGVKKIECEGRDDNVLNSSCCLVRPGALLPCKRVQELVLATIHQGWSW